jgi:hypothetical protein
MSEYVTHQPEPVHMPSVPTKEPLVKRIVHKVTTK